MFKQGDFNVSIKKSAYQNLTLEKTLNVKNEGDTRKIIGNIWWNDF